MVSINLNPGYAIYGSVLLNTLVNNAYDLSKLAGFNLKEFGTYFKYADAGTTSWYIPSVSYSMFVHDRISFETGIGLYSTSFLLDIPKDKAGALLEALGQSGYGEVIGTDTTFNSSFYYIPLTIGVKFYGPKRMFYNSFKFGIDSVVYSITTLNGLTGVKTRHDITDIALYASYEIGWNIELFPTKDWRVKPTLDIAVLEIGYYFRPWQETAYSSIIRSFDVLTAGFLNNLNIPTWEKLPSWFKMYSRVRFALFPRIGFSLRF